jgi:hypothetical protein
VEMVSDMAHCKGTDSPREEFAFLIFWRRFQPCRSAPLHPVECRLPYVSNPGA